METTNGFEETDFNGADPADTGKISIEPKDFADIEWKTDEVSNSENVGPEATEIFHSPEPKAENEPGGGKQPAWDGPPDAALAPIGIGVLGLTDQASSENELESESQSSGDQALDNSLSPVAIGVLGLADQAESPIGANSESSLEDSIKADSRQFDDLDYRSGDINSQIQTIQWAGDVMAAQERHDAGLAAQQAGDLGSALAATAQNLTAGEGPEEMADKMVQYVSSQHSIDPAHLDELPDEKNAEDQTENLATPYAESLLGLADQVGQGDASDEAAASNADAPTEDGPSE